jgi:hypothetical protein
MSCFILSSSHQEFITYVRGILTIVGLDSVVRSMLQIVHLNCTFCSLCSNMAYTVYGCTVPYHTSLPGHVYLQEKQNALQEKPVGSMKRKKRYLFGNLFRASKKRNTPSGQKLFNGQRLDRPDSAAQLEPTESLRSPGTKCEPTAMASTELRKHARQIGGHTAAATAAVHMRRAIHATILVLAKIVPFAPMRVRKHSVGFSNQLELFFIATLEPQAKKKGHHPSYQQHSERGRRTLSG